MGASTNSLPELSHIKLKPIKGQILEMEWPANIEKPHTLISSQTYLLVSQTSNRCIVGATFEKQFSSTEADLELAKKEILSKTAAYLPAIAHAKPLNCHAGLRAVTPNRRPLLTQVNDRCWVLTGMGSKGLLYHALLAEELAKISLI
jgi:glycine/D-amino acid oxidase-like deaminating enzyme